jgi:hypothetical protein
MNAEWHTQHVMPKNATDEQRVAWHAEHAKFCACRPIPETVKRLIERVVAADSPPARGVDIHALLSGGDRRGIAQSNRARVLIEHDPSLVSALATLTEDEDQLIVQRALDLLEKLAHEHPAWIEPHKATFIGPLAESDRWEMRLQIVRALPLFSWTPAQFRRVESILEKNVRFPQTFVRAWALDSLATFSERRKKLAPIVERYLREFERSSSKALQARARQIRARLNPTRPSARTPKARKRARAV